MKRISLLFLFTFLLTTVCPAQQPQPVVQQVDTNRVNVYLPAPPSPVPSGAAAVIGNSGPATYYYWVVARNAVANSQPAGPFTALFAPNSLSSSNYNQVSWQPSNTATGYDVLRTLDPNVPQGTCNCAVATNVTSTTQNDQSNSLNAYTVTNFNPATLTLSLTNEVQSAGVSHMILRQNNVFVADLSMASGTTFPLLAPNGTAAAPSYSWVNDTHMGFYRVGSGDQGFSVASTKVMDFKASGISLVSAAQFDWNGDLILVRNAANVLALQNGTNPQGMRLFTCNDNGDATSAAWGIQTTTRNLLIEPFDNTTAGVGHCDNSKTPQDVSIQANVNLGNGIIGLVRLGNGGIDTFDVNGSQSPGGVFLNVGGYHGTGATVTANTMLLDLSQTWNNGAVAFTGIKENITDTASAASSLLIDLQVSGSSRFNVSKGGDITIAGLNIFTNGGSLQYQLGGIFGLPSVGIPIYNANAMHQGGGSCITVGADCVSISWVNGPGDSGSAVTNTLGFSMEIGPRPSGSPVTGVNVYVDTTHGAITAGSYALRVARDDDDTKVSFGYDTIDHLVLGGKTSPTITAGCGTSPTITGFDSAFMVDVGTTVLAVNSCTITFGNTYTTRPACTVSQSNDAGFATIVSPTASSTATTVKVSVGTNFTTDHYQFTVQCSKLGS